MINVDAQSAVKIEGVIAKEQHVRKVKTKYLKLASDVIEDKTICVRKKREQIKELGKQQEEELKKSI